MVALCVTSPRTLRTTKAAETADQPAAAVALTESQKGFQRLALVWVKWFSVMSGKVGSARLPEIRGRA
jgi:hypothetical protein